MNDSTNRREFLQAAGIVGAGLAALAPGALHAAEPTAAAAKSTAAVPTGGAGAGGASAATTQPATKPATRPAKVDKPLVIGVVGTAGRGTELANGFALLPGSVVKYVCDVDDAHLKKAAAAVASKQDAEPQAVKDLRRVVEDPAVDAIAIATPDHWHAPAALIAMAHGKHVYVEKPASHNAREGELLVEASRRHKRVFQHGTQRRSWPKNVEAIARVKAGDVGKVLVSRGWYNNTRPETGRRTPASVPPGLDWDLWQGPAPRREYTENVVHYKWHWFWHWGTGELGNNGIHALDVCRWGLGVDYPRRVTAGGGRYHFQDEQETPDTMSVTYDFGDRMIVWEGRSCHPHGFEGSGFGVAFYGDKATMIIDGGGYRIVDPKGKVIEKVTGPGSNAEHLQNFLDGINGAAKTVADAEEAHKSTLLCHLGNIAYRTGRTVNCDPKTGRIAGEDKEAVALWGREYDKGWEPKA